MRHYIYLLSVMIVLLSTGTFAQNETAKKANYPKKPSVEKIDGYTVKKGARPHIALKKVPESDYEKGVLKIKFNKNMEQHLQKHSISKSREGNISFSISTVDKINEKYGVSEAHKIFNTSPKNKHAKRHKAWGFHLWYKLKVDKSTDIKGLVHEYKQLAEIEFAEPEYKKVLYDGKKIKNAPKSKWTPNDTRYNEQWHYHNTGQTSGTTDADIDLPEAWDIEKGHHDVIVSVQDGGIQTDHPELDNNIWSGVGYDFVNDDATIEPGDHGTHVAGTVAGETNNSNGISGVAGGDGTTKGVALMSCQVFTDASSGGFEQAPIWAADNGACISQNSWGYTSVGVYDQVVLDAIDYFNTNGGGSQLNGGITIYAAGNDGTEGDWYPGCYEGAFAVAATTHTDQKAYYSNYGTWVDISAPGGETATLTEGILSTVTGSGYDFYQGTSMACPHVSGVASLIVSYAYRNGVTLNNTDVADILKNSVDDHYGVNGSYIGKIGTGRMNAYQALQATIDYISGTINPAAFEATPNGTDQIDLNWTQNTDGNDVMVAWSADGTFGTPTDGNTYAAGDAITGGGTVLYSGANTTYSHNSLSPATTYYYKAFSYNASNEYSSGRTTNATTDCDILTLPHYQIFDDGVMPPLCWSTLDNDGDGNNWTIGSTPGYEPHTGSNVAMSASYAGSALTPDNWLISPQFAVGADILELKFYVKAQDPAWPAEKYSVLVSTTGTATTDFTEIHSETLASDTWKEVSLNLTGYNGNNIYIAFRHWDCTDQFQILLDDISIEEVQTGTPVAASNPSPTDNQTDVATDGTLTWTWGADTDTYDLWFGPAGAMVKVVDGVTAGAEGTQGSYSYSGLSAITSYEWQVISHNTTDGLSTDGSVWSFTTTCGIISTFPYTEGFESGSLPNCWSYDGTDWAYQSGGHSGNPASAHSGSYNALFYHSSTTADVSKLVMPVMDFTGYSSANFSFWHTQPVWASDQDELRVYYKATPGDSWTMLTEYTGDIPSWTQENITLPNLSSTYQIAFEATGQFGYGVSIDDIEITVANTVTFTVDNENGDLLDGAAVTIGAEEILTDPNGEATFLLPNGDYDYTVVLDGYDEATGSVSIVDANVDEAVTLIETIENPTALAVEVNGYDATLTWDIAGAPLELVQHSGVGDDGGYFQNFGNGYGVVFDLSTYTDATITEMDFHHVSWELTGTWDYKVHVIDWDAQSIVYTTDMLATTGDDQWEEGIDLNLITGLGGGNVGIFIEPFGNTNDDAYPCVNTDGNPDGASFYGPLNDLASMSASTSAGDFILDLWITTANGKAVAAEPAKLNANTKAHNVARVDNGAVAKDYVTVKQEAKSLVDYNVFLDDLTTPVATNVTGNSYDFIGLTIGTYTAGVQRVYETGVSDIVTIDFEIVEPTYEVAFTVTDASDSHPITGASIDINSQTLTTNTGGEASLYLANGTYPYTVSNLGYFGASASVTVNNGNVIETVQLTPYDPITFTATPTDVTCNGSADGSIAITDVAGGSGVGYEYSIDGGTTWQTSASFADLIPDTYDVVVSDDEGNTSGATTVTVGEPDVVSYTVAATDVSAGSDGEIQFNDLAGGSGTYLFTTDGGTSWASTNPVTGLSEGDYTVNVKDDNDCMATQQTVTIGATEQTITFLVQDAGDAHALDGASISINSTTLTSNINGEATINLIHGDYPYTVSRTGYEDASATLTVGGTAFTETVQLTALPAITFNTTVTNVACNGGSDGEIEITDVSGGTGTGYEYSANGGTDWQASPIISGLAAGTYDIIVQDDDGNTSDPVSVTITEPDAITFSINTTDVSSSGAADGTIEFVSVAGGNGVYEYSIDNGTSWQTSSLFTGLSEGNYQLFVKDGFSCQSDVQEATIGLQEHLITFMVEDESNHAVNGAEIDINSTTLISDINGEATISLINGDYPYTVSYSGYFDETGTVTVNGTPVSETVTLTPNIPISFSTDVTDATCNGSNDGLITIIDVTGGTGTGYEYSIDAGTTWQTSETFTSLSAGTYDARVKDDGGNISTVETVTISEPAGITFDVNITGVSASGNSDGTIEFANATGGNGTFEYSIDGGSTWQTSTLFSGLAEGTYDAVVQDGNLCLSETQTVTIGVGTTPYAVTFIVEDASGLSAIEGANIAINSTSLITDETGSATIELVNGIYSYTVNKSGYHEASGSVNVSGAELTETVQLNPILPITFTATPADVTCNGGSDGIIDITSITGGSGTGYEYSIDGGTTWVVNNTFTGLTAGNYNVAVKDDAGYTSDISVVTITEPAAISFDVSIIGVSTSGASDGEIAFTNTTGGSGTYEYSIDGGLTWLASATFTSLAVGSYDAMVKDANGCLSSVQTVTVGIGTTEYVVTFTIQDADDSQVIEGATITINSTTLSSDINGEASISLSNGSYSYTVIKDGFQDGAGSISVNGANVSETVLLTPIYPVTFTATSTNVSCNGSADGIITIEDVSGGTGAGYEYSNDGGTTWQASSMFTNLIAGNYDIQVRDGAGTTSTINTITITEPDAVIFSTDVTNVSTNGGSDGAIEFTSVTGGTGAYEYSIDGGITWQTNSLFSGLAAGSYAAIVMDANGCLADQQSVTITEPAPAEYTVTFIVQIGSDFVQGATVDINGQLLTTDENGEATIDLVNGDYPYTVSVDGYEDVNGTVTVAGADVTELLVLPLPSYMVTFNVTDGAYPITGATISIDGGTLTTDDNGEATIELINGEYPYTANADGFDETSGTIIVAGEPVNEDVVLSLPSYTVSFNVTADGAAAEGASIEINSITITTDESGLATIELTNGDYPYMVSFNGYDDISETVTVNGADVDVPVDFTGLEDISATGKIYPNPSTGIVNIEWPTECEVTIINATGEIVEKAKIKSNGSINMTNEAEGLYMIRIETANSVTTKRLIIRQ